jgi:hypothetical protein
MVCLSLTGCVSTAENLQRETARFVGDISPDQVRVSNVQRGITDVKWEAETPKGTGRCRTGYCRVAGLKLKTHILIAPGVMNVGFNPICADCDQSMTGSAPEEGEDG